MNCGKHVRINACRSPNNCLGNKNRRIHTKVCNKQGFFINFAAFHDNSFNQCKRCYPGEYNPIRAKKFHLRLLPDEIRLVTEYCLRPDGGRFLDRWSRHNIATALGHVLALKLPNKPWSCTRRFITPASVSPVDRAGMHGCSDSHLRDGWIWRSHCIRRRFSSYVFWAI